jgi:hypothetical protein
MAIAAALKAIEEIRASGIASAGGTERRPGPMRMSTLRRPR